MMACYALMQKTSAVARTYSFAIKIYKSREFKEELASKTWDYFTSEERMEKVLQVYERVMASIKEQCERR